MQDDGLDEEKIRADPPLECLIPRFREMKRNPSTYCSTVHLTSAEVVLTTTTTKMVRDLSKRTLHPLNRLVLPTRKSLPAVKIKPKRLNKKLIRERDKFMKRLQKERQDREQLEAWAASKLQRVFRKYLARPGGKVPYRKKARRTSMANIRADVCIVYNHPD